MAKKPAEPLATGPAPSPGRIVHFFDREEIVEAARTERDPEPTVGLIRRVRNAEGACDLVLFTDLGPRNLDAVPLADHHAQAGAWAFPARV